MNKNIGIIHRKFYVIYIEEFLLTLLTMVLYSLPILVFGDC